MDLILWRHAQAEALPLPEGATVTAGALTIEIDWAADLARELTPKGHRQAAAMGAWLRDRLPDDARVLVSPAQRAQQTALALGRTFKTVRAIDPRADVDAVLRAARWSGETGGTVVVVGHQPTLGMVAARLMTGQDLAWSVRKGGVWWLRSRARQGDQRLVLHAVVNPETL
jgi:phosphohistidine phosphatase